MSNGPASTIEPASASGAVGAADAPRAPGTRTRRRRAVDPDAVVRRRRLARAAVGPVAAIASGVLLALAYGLHPQWWAAWIAPIPLFIAVAAPRSRWFTAIGLGALAGAIGSASMFGYLAGLAGPPDAIGLSLARAAMWAVFALAAHHVLRRIPPAIAALALPALIAGAEVVTAAASPHGSAGTIALSQIDVLPVLQLASFGGVAAIVFALALGWTIATLIVLRPAVWRTLLVPVAVLAIALGAGGTRLAVPAESTSVRIGLVAVDGFDGVPEQWRHVWSAYGPGIEAAARDGATIVVLPEKIATVPNTEVTALLVDAQALAAGFGIDLAFGIDERGETAVNRMYLVLRDGTVTAYDKRHLIPGIESHFVTGDAPVITKAGGVDAGLAICKDLDFAGTMREYGGRAALMVVPAWDFVDDGWFHSRLAVLRGVEQGMAVARAPREGVFTLSDADGRVVAQAPTSAGDGGDLQVLVGDLDVPQRSGTVYTAVGDGFGWAALAIGVATWLIAATRRPHRRPRHAA